MEVSLAEIKVDFEKYINLIDKQDILITNKGVEIARLVRKKSEEDDIAERVAAMKEFIGCAKTDQEIDIDKIRLERFA
jgi:hypothetical protein